MVVFGGRDWRHGVLKSWLQLSRHWGERKNRTWYLNVWWKGKWKPEKAKRTRHCTKHIVIVKSLSRVRIFCTPMDCSLPGSSVHGISQARTLEWVAISFSRGSSHPRDWICVSCLAGGFFTTEAIWEDTHPQYLVVISFAIYKSLTFK